MPTLKTILVTCWFSSECFGLLSKHFDLCFALWLNPVSPDSPFNITVITSIFTNFGAELILSKSWCLCVIWDIVKWVSVQWDSDEVQNKEGHKRNCTAWLIIWGQRRHFILIHALIFSLNLVFHCPEDLARSVLVKTFGIEEKTDGNRNTELIRFWCSLGSLRPLVVRTLVYVRPE